MAHKRKKEEKMWYYGTREGKWYLEYPRNVSEYKRNEGISQSEMKKIGRKKAKEKVLSPTIYVGVLAYKKGKSGLYEPSPKDNR